MRVLLDTTVLNWLTDNPTPGDVFFAARAAGRLEVLVTPEVAAEIGNTREPARRTQLQGTLARFPLSATRTPRLDFSFVLNLAQLPTKQDERTLEAVSFLHDQPDRDLTANAAGQMADYFLTCDGEILKKKARLELVLGRTSVMHPAEFVRTVLSGQGGSDLQ